MPSPAAAPFADLTPDAVLNAIDATGVMSSGSLLALNSYENRVFQVGVKDGAQRFVVAKFYRPGRWSDAQILEEHAFTQELADAEVPAVPPLAIDGRTLHERAGYRFALYPRRTGRAPDLRDPEVCRRLGRWIGRLHAIAGGRSYAQRPPLMAGAFNVHAIAGNAPPPELRPAHASAVAQALAEIRRCSERAGDLRPIRLHGDLHAGKVLWRDHEPCFIDFDESRMGPAVQDLWMLLSGSREQQQAQLADLLAGYEDFAEFDRRELQFVEALRTLRLIRSTTLAARRAADAAADAWARPPRFWEQRIAELRERIEAMRAPALAM